MNTSFRLAPWADVLYAMDLAWWGAYLSEVAGFFRGLCINPWRKMQGVECVKFDHMRNSGAGAVSLAATWGARRIIMLGFDCQKTGGRAHWHPDHPNRLGNAGSVDRWPAIFRELSRKLAGVEVLNASRTTALAHFPRVDLDEVLQSRAPATQDVVYVAGMHGMGDNLHQRAVVRELMRDSVVWLETPWPSVYHDLVGDRLHLISRGSKLRTQAKNAQRESDLFERASLPASNRRLVIKYPPDSVRSHRGVLQGMSATVGVPVGDFRMQVPADWRHGLALPDDRPVLVVRPLIERLEWSGCKSRNPDVASYIKLFKQLRERFFVVSVADLVPDVEWMVHADLGADITLHAGQLGFRELAALWRDAAMVYTAPGFGVVLAQAVGTPVVTVFGGYESAYSFSAGAAHTPTLAIEPVKPCDCFSHNHRCEKRIDMQKAAARLEEFTNEHCAQPALC